MKIVERYSRPVKIFKGEGRYRFLTPARMLSSLSYGAVLEIRDRVRRRRRRRGGDETGPTVISVGNLEVGGGGKTPCTIAIARHLLETGKSPVVVTRGYRSLAEKSGRIVIVPDRWEKPEVDNPVFVSELEFLKEIGDKSGKTGYGLLAEALGDETLLYRSRGIPVVIDRKRDQGLRVAGLFMGATHVLLDDAFQRIVPTKDIDILLLDWEKPFGNGRLLPLGTLRERPSAVGRADKIVFTRAGDRRIPAEAAALVDGKPVFFARYIVSGLEGRSGVMVDPGSLRDHDIALFSGIARPESFESSVIGLGLSPGISFRFDDHHRYSRRDIISMIREAGEGAAFVTTEKDRGKAQSLFPQETSVYSLILDLELDGIEDLVAKG